MNKSKIEWCDYTWNPVTGCLHGCQYCYAQRIANRFYTADFGGFERLADGGLKVLEEPIRDKNNRIVPYPWCFEPTFHKYRLDEPARKKKPAKIFVVSMGDLFGEWVPDKWISEVITAISKAPWHTYMMLTKNPERYWDYFEGAYQSLPDGVDLTETKLLLGTSITNQKDADNLHEGTLKYLDFLSIEPLLGDIDTEDLLCYESEYYRRWSLKWVIVGAQTGPGAVKPKPEWVQSIIEQCREAGVPLFLKDNLNWPEKIQEFPEGVPHD